MTSNCDTRRDMFSRPLPRTTPPCFRIFNPWLQQKRFDPQGEYLRRWLPELATVPLRALHMPPQAGQQLAPDYPLP